MFGIGNQKGRITDDTPEPDGKVIARISVDKVSPGNRKVKAYAVSRKTGKTVYKLRFETKLAEMKAYRSAEDQLKQFLSENDFVIDGDIQTNINLPFVRTTKNRMR